MQARWHFNDAEREISDKSLIKYTHTSQLRYHGRTHISPNGRNSTALNQNLIYLCLLRHKKPPAMFLPPVCSHLFLRSILLNFAESSLPLIYPWHKILLPKWKLIGNFRNFSHICICKLRFSPSKIIENNEIFSE